ncbi:glucose dehydrogenase [FAD, quinone]-like isoform X2 [Planococcus citri]|uniref:glucose dehydrogenase [FAD, quinone]-like isoform X2 n=1 Tax=Planococcus citri TaxID=170843 RepID=UPI0031F96B0F
MLPLTILWLWLVKSSICLDYSDYPADYSPDICENSNAYDFIVAGAGSGGSTLASRLSEEASWTVLLLEKGQDPPPLSETPILWASLLKSDVDYKYVSQPDEFLFKGLEGNVSSIPRGKLSGGCSSVNVAVYLRGHRKDYDTWEKLGCDGWNYDSIKKYFLKSEDYRGYSPEIYEHHKGGPLTVSAYESPDPAVEVFSEGFAEMGLPRVTDLNGPVSVGYGSADSTTRDGKRCSTYKAFISITKPRKNFHFARGVTVLRVVFDETLKRAIGVEVLAPSGKKCVIRATKEVILSLGAIGSPQILMLSGIGPKKHLKKMKIPLVANLPVGRNWQDHPCYVGLVFTDRKNRLPDQIKAESLQLIKDTYALYQNGIATMGMTKLMAFINTKNDGTSYPDIQLMTMRISYQTMWSTVNKRHKLYNMFGLSEETASFFTDLNNQSDSIFIILILSESKSTGYMELNSADPLDYPKIYPNFLRHEDDFQSLLNGVRFVEKFAQTEALKKYGFEFEFIDYQACRKFEKGSDEYWRCAFEQLLSGFYHPGGTNKMGAESDPTTVLNPRMKVKNIENLRVVDASAMAKLVSVNPNAAVIMMAEKAADMIKEDHCVMNFE